MGLCYIFRGCMFVCKLTRRGLCKDVGQYLGLMEHEETFSWGNNNLFLVAYAIAEAEDKHSWEMFLELLSDDLGCITSTLTWVHELS